MAISLLFSSTPRPLGPKGSCGGQGLSGEGLQPKHPFINQLQHFLFIRRRY